MGFSIHVVGPEGRMPALDVQKTTITLGRGEGNDLVLDAAAVSKRHVRIQKRDQGFLVEDLGSTNGTWLAGERLVGAKTTHAAQAIRLGVGPFQIEIREAAAEAVAGEESQKPVQKQGSAFGMADEAALRRKIHEQVIVALDLRRLDIDRLGEGELRRKTEEAIDRILDRLAQDDGLPPSIERERLRKDLADEALGLGALEELLADDEISEVMVNGPSRIYVEKAGRISLSPRIFSSEQAVLGVIERIVAQVGRRIDESSPMVDARLRDGSRVHAIIPPLSLTGPCITIRKFRRERLGMDDLVRFGALSESMKRFLELAVGARKNIIISGGTGSGKTTLLNVLTELVSENERIITVEDAAELQIRQPHWIQLEARPPNLEGKGAVSIRDLVKGCLRMRPDRIVVGECRGGEALDMLQAMNTGHDGSLTTLHSNSPRDALARLETLCLMSGMDLPIRAIREQVANAVDLIIQQTRFADGSRKITSITEVVGMEGEKVTLQEIFAFERGHRSRGFVPTFCEEMIQQGLPVDLTMFRMED